VADTELKDLTAATSVISTDLLYTVVDPSGTPLDRKIAVGNLVASINALVDHGSLAGLTDDDHTQYAFLNGRSGGQLLFGGTNSSEALYLYGSSGGSYSRIALNFDAMVVKHAVGIGGDPLTVTNLLQLYNGGEPTFMTQNSVGLYSKDFAANDARLYVFSEFASAGTAVVIGAGSIILAANASGGALYGSAAAAPTILTIRTNTDSAQGGYLDLGDSVRLITSASPAQITADQHNYSPGSYVSVVRLTSDASRNITGIIGTGGADGRLLVVHNVGSNDIVLKHESASSSAGARFNLPGNSDMTLRAGASVFLRFDNTSSRWRAAGAALWGDALVKAAQIQSTAATGTAPLIVASTTAVTNLNADLLDGQHGSAYLNAGNINTGTLALARGGTGTNLSGAVKGDMIAALGSDSFGLLGVGADKQVLTADSSATRGVSWQSVPLPPGYRSGMPWYRGVDTVNDVQIYSGYCRSSDNSYNISLTLDPITKQLDAAWAAGDNAGGLDTGSRAANTWYWIWAIARSDTGNADVLLSTSNTSPVMPANYDKKRLIGAIRTGASTLDNIDTRYVGGGIYLRYLDPGALDVSVTNLGTSRATYTLTRIPAFGNSYWLSVYFDANVAVDHASLFSIVYIANPDHVDSAPSASATPLASISMASATQQIPQQLQLYANRSAQITARSNNTSTTFRVQVLGFFWPGGI